MALKPDTPLLIRSEQPWSTSDLLGRSDFAARVATHIKELRQDEEGFTISLEAPWGHGKSWMLGKIRQELIGHAHCITFSPWLVGNFDGLLKEFLNLLGQELGKHTATRKVAKTIADFITESVSPAFLATSEPALAATGVGLNAIKGLANRLLGLDSTISALYQTIHDALKGQTRKFVVLVDDIDRLRPREVSEVIRLIQAVGKLPNVIYVIALDVAYVEKALEEAKHPKAAQYLEKIIQMRLSLPPQAKAKLAKIVEADLDQLKYSEVYLKAPGGKDACEAAQESFFYWIVNSLESIRDWNRVWNRFLFIEQGIRGLANPVEVLALCCVVIKAPSLYDQMVVDQGRFVFDVPVLPVIDLDIPSVQLQNGADRVRSRKKEFTDFRASMPEVTENAWRLVLQLFPKLQYPDFASRPAREDGSLQILANLEAVLNASELSERLPHSVLNAIFFDQSTRQAALARINTQDLFEDYTFELRLRDSQFYLFDNPVDFAVQLATTENRFPSNERFEVTRLTYKFCKNLYEQLIENKSVQIANETLFKIFDKLVLNQFGRCVILQLSISEATLSHSTDTELRILKKHIDLQASKKIVQKAAKLLFQDLDQGLLKHVSLAQRSFWSLRHISPIRFSEITATRTRFHKWCAVMAMHPHGWSSSNRAILSFHIISQSIIDNFKSPAVIQKWISELPTEPSHMISFKSAMENPDKRYVFGTDQVLS
jgi:KAP family P-loop domain